MLTPALTAVLVLGFLILVLCGARSEGFCGPPNFYNERRPGFLNGHIPGTASLLWAYNDREAQSHDPVNMQYMNPQYTAQQYAMAPYPAWCTKSGCATNCH